MGGVQVEGKELQTMSVMIMLMQKFGGLITGEKVDGRRRNYFVEKEFQKNFVIFFLVTVTVLIVASGTAFYAFFNHLLEQNIYTIHPKARSIKDIITPNLIIYFIVVTAIAMIIIVIAVDRLLNSIARSLKTYELIAQRLARLDFKTASATEVDRFFPLHRQYKGLIGKYSTDIIQLREQVTRLGGLIASREEKDHVSEGDNLAFFKELSALKNAVEAKLVEYELDRE
jgi:hypothetical protein